MIRQKRCLHAGAIASLFFAGRFFPFDNDSVASDFGLHDFTWNGCDKRCQFSF